MIEQRPKIKVILNIIIAIVWIGNGLFSKILNMVPRHQLIVSRILGAQHAVIFTKLIGLLEVLMAVWILSYIKPKCCALAQMVIVAVMNIIEFVMAPDLLLFGHINAVVAAVFVSFVYINTFVVGNFK